MDGLMMDYALTIPALLRRADELYGGREIVSRLPDGSLHRYTYADFVDRSKRLALALRRLGVGPGDRVATLGWNHYAHLEAYFGVPSAGAVLHTINLRLPREDITYITHHANDRVLLVDEALLPLYEAISPTLDIPHVIVTLPTKPVREGLLDYERLLAAEDPQAFAYPDLPETSAAAMSYTSGTTGRPKGVLYSHRAIVLHTLGLGLAETFGITGRDTILPVVPMFHVNAWGLPFTGVMVGSKIVLPGPHLDPASLLELFAGEKVTFTGGVPTIWFGILDALDKEPGRYDLSALRAMAVGGAAAPPSMIKAFDERHHLTVVHAWGMTETTPLGSVSHLPPEMDGADEADKLAIRARQGTPVPFVEVRARGEAGLVPWDGRTAGELEVRGPWIASQYFGADGPDDRFTDDGWFKTGDIVTIAKGGSIHIQDRSKDVIKSGGEWISSVILENAIMGHPAVAEAAVIAIPHPKWQERPLACVVLRDGMSASEEEILGHITPHFPKWWIPDRVAFVDAIPKTAAGKFLKSALRERFGKEAS